MNLSELLKSTRQYFWDQGFDEVEVPYLNSSLPLEPNIYPFIVSGTGSSTKYYLPTSPEMALKKHLADAKKNCFAISHCFRDLESTGPHHLPEFLMLEYYLVNQNLADLQQSLKKYISQFMDIKFSESTLPSNLPDNEPDFNQFFLNEFEPTLPADSAVFITGYPAYLAPLAKTSREVANFSDRSECEHPDNASGAEPEGSEDRKNSATSKGGLANSARFELYINGIEIANGCEENRDPNQILKAFKAENSYRQKNHLPLHPYSPDFIKNCSLLPPCSGVGIGLNRLLMVLNGQKTV